MTISFNNSFLNQLDLPYLKYFFAVASYGGYSKASRATGIAQPTLSVGVKKLEESLETILIERDSKNFSLTSAGISLFDSCWRIDGVLENFVMGIGGKKPSVNRRLRIGSGFSCGYSIVEDICMSAATAEDAVEFELFNDSTYKLLTALKEGKIDAAIIPDEVQDSQISIHQILNDHVTFVVSSKHSHLFQGKKAKENWKEALLELILVTYPRETQMRYLINQLTIKHALKFKSEISINGLEGITSFVKRGIGGAFVMRSLVENELKNKTLIEPELPIRFPKRGMILATRKDATGNEIASYLMSRLKNTKM